jgi:hypothetical protein
MAGCLRCLRTPHGAGVRWQTNWPRLSPWNRSPLLATKRVAWMKAFRAARRRGVPYLDTLPEPQPYRPNRLWEPGRPVGVSPDTASSATPIPLSFAPPPQSARFCSPTSPGADEEPNWLPAPNGPIYMVMRLYWPRTEPPSILLAPGEGMWKPLGLVPH